MIKACIFDLDGVVVDTAKFHFLAWQRLASEIGIVFTHDDNERLKGVSRMDSLNIILSIGNKQMSDTEKDAACAKKNIWFMEYVEAMTPADTLPGVESFMLQLQKHGVKIALGSSSKNAVTILKKINMLHFFEAIIDGNGVTNAKPDPEVFIKGASALGVDPHNCVVFEDGEAGVEAARRALMHCVGIGSESVLGKADFCVPGFENLSLERVLAL